MKVRLLLHMPEGTSDITPSVVAAIDEWTYDAGVEWYGDNLEEVERLWGPGPTREIIVDLPDDAVTGVFVPPHVPARIEGDDE